MANRPPGGYIIRVDDSGSPSAVPAGTLDNPRQFDGADLQPARSQIHPTAKLISFLEIHQTPTTTTSYSSGFRITATDFLCR